MLHTALCGREKKNRTAIGDGYELVRELTKTEVPTVVGNKLEK